MNPSVDSLWKNANDKQVQRLLPSITESLKDNLASDPHFILNDFEPTYEELVEHKRLKEERHRRRKIR